MPDSDPEQEWEETQHKSRTARYLAEKMIKHP